MCVCDLSALYLIRELESLRPPRDARFDRTLGGVPGQIVCALEATGAEQHIGFLHPDGGEFLKIDALHRGCGKA